jgi:predicted FMN-binding regulatory protein PaiB
MYMPTGFEENDRHVAIELVKTYPFATFVTHSEDGLVANHVPLVVSSEGEPLKLAGHLVRANLGEKRTAKARAAAPFLRARLELAQAHALRRTYSPRPA